MLIRFQRPLDNSRRVLWAAAAPWIVSGVSALAGSQGSKKAAKSATPKIPGAFRPDLASALGVLGQGLQQGFPRYQGPLVAGFDPMSSAGLAAAAGPLNAAGQGGLDSALATIRGISATGLDPSQIQSVRDTLAPFFNYQKQQTIAGTREAEAAGGRFFGTGGVQAENNALNQLLANQSSQVIPAALQATQLRLGAAGALPGFLGGEQGLGLGLLGAGQQRQQSDTAQMQAAYQEFLRTQPQTAIPLLAQLMGGTPNFFQPQGVNALQLLGGMGGSLFSSPGFWNYLSSLGGPKSGTIVNPIFTGAGAGQPGSPFQGPPAPNPNP